ncbi:MAG: hypothetical protein C0418_02750 [Coriobacteriaceae bacterium]|nr:hypothetical protein [Coriobacteriaceae bacterium]
MTSENETNDATRTQHGEHIDTIESVDAVFRQQRKLSFTYGAVFFIVTLFIPLGTVAFQWWHETPIWGGFSLNYLVVSLLYYVFLWGMAWMYSKQADTLDTKLHMENDAGGGV